MTPAHPENAATPDRAARASRAAGRKAPAGRHRQDPDNPDADTVSPMLDLVRLPGVQDRFPAPLSGGQQQRIALAISEPAGPDPRWGDRAAG